MIILLSACKKNNEPINNISNTPESAFIEVSPENDHEKTCITYASGFEDREYILEVIARYNAENDKNITVLYQELTAKERDNYEHVKTQFEKDSNNYDIINVKNQWLFEFEKAGYLLDITDFVYGDLGVAEYVNSVVDIVKFNEKFMAFPRTIETSLTFIRNDILTYYPDDRTEFIEYKRALVEELTKEQTEEEQTDIIHGYIFLSDDDEEFLKLCLESIYSENGKIFDDSGKLKIERDGVIAGLESVKELVLSEEYGKYTRGYCINSFLRGKVIVLRSETGKWNLTKNLNDDIKARVSIINSDISKDSSNPVLTGTSNIINKNSVKQEASWDFIRYLSNFENQLEMSTRTGKLPVIKSLYTNVEITNEFAFYSAKEILDTVNDGNLILTTDNYYYAFDTLTSIFRKYINDEITAEEVCDLIETELTKQEIE